ncbi:MAG: hypothetical protein ABIH69_04650 [bacterium]
MISKKKKMENTMKMVGFFAKVATIAVFFCILITTINTVKVSKQTLKTMRPWVAPTKIFPFFHKDMMTVKVQIQNVSKLPAFISLDGSMQVGGQTRKVDSEPTISIIMPDQIILTSFVLKDVLYKEVLSGSKKLIINIKVNYTDEKDEPEKYFSYTEWEFNPSLIPASWSRIGPLEMAGIWTVKNADMN